MADEQNAASSPAAVAVETPSEPIPLEQFTSEQRDEWLKTGKTPEAAPKKADATAKESSEPPPAEPAAAEAKPAPASEPGSEQEPKPAPGEKRKGQLANEIQQLLKQRAELRQENERIAAERARTTSAAPAEPAEPAGLTKPEPEDFEKWEEYETAKDVYYERMAEAKATAAVEADRQALSAQAQQATLAAQNRKIESDWSKRTKEFIASHPEAKDFNPAVATLANSGLVPENSPLDRWILESPRGHILAWHFSQNPDEILRLGELDPSIYQPWGAISPISSRELVTLENSFESKTPATVPVQKEHTAAPKPPVVVSARAAAPADEVEAAIQSGNQGAYMEAMNRRELAARKG